jgi:hypothetical protein
MRRFPALVLVLALVPAAVAQELLAGIDRDVLHALLLPGDQALNVSSTVPEELADLRMPRELTWVGSLERSPDPAATQAQTSVTAAWRSGLPLTEAERLAASALEEQGWTLSMNMRSQPSVFVAPMSQATDVWCRDGRQLSFTAGALGATSYVVLNFQKGAPTGFSPGCVPRPPMTQSALASDLPRLELPLDPRTGAPAAMRGSSSGSSPTGLSFSTTFQHAAPAPDIASHFARQLEQQGWKQDAGWAGTDFAGSVWSRSRASGGAVVVTLHVVDRGGNTVLALVNVSARTE